MEGPAEFSVLGASTDHGTGQFHLSGESQSPKLPFFRPCPRSLCFCRAGREPSQSDIYPRPAKARNRYNPVSSLEDSAGSGMHISAPFIRRPIGTSLLTAAILLAGAVSYYFLPVAPLP